MVQSQHCSGWENICEGSPHRSWSPGECLQAFPANSITVSRASQTENRAPAQILSPNYGSFFSSTIMPSGETQIYISLCLHGRVFCTYFLRTGFHKDTNNSQRISGDICCTYSRGLWAVWRPHTAWLPISALLWDLQQIFRLS